MWRLVGRKAYNPRGVSSAVITADVMANAFFGQNLVGYPRLALVREKLSVKAKSEPKFRFCNLKRLVVETETLKCAWAQAP